jgi:uncharacterized protein
MTDTLTLTSLPLFPLGTVLYPGGFLPLRIFEVRYLDMIGKCHKTGAPFGVVALTEGVEVRRPASPKAESAGNASGEGGPAGAPGSAPPSGDGFANEAFNAVGTLATIEELTVPQPGLMVIRCTGMQRFEISRREKLKHGLWIADVARVPDDQSIPIPDDLQRVASALGGVIKTLQARAVPAAQMPLQPPYRLDDCAWVANRWCELLPMPLALKQRMMALDNPLVRLELVSDMLERTGIAT